MPERILVRNTQSPGDYIVLSAAIRDLARAHPGRFEFMMDVPQPAVFQANPYLKPFPKQSARRVVAKYPLIHKSNQQRVHFIWGFIEYLNAQLNAKARLTEFRPDLHLTEAEKQKPPAGIEKPYWIIVSGGKRDYTAKWWDPRWWQIVVDRLAPRVPLIQVGGGSHVHPRLKNVRDLVAKTSFRQLMQLIYHSEGVLCIVTCMMHIAAAFNRPCVVVAGGREPAWWEAYDRENRVVQMQRGVPDWQPPKDDNFIPHRYLHTMGKLDCCKNKGCWKARIGGKGSVCLLPVKQNGILLPRCLQMITPEMVLENVEWYYKEGILSWSKAAHVVDLRVEPIPKPPPPPKVQLVRELSEAVSLAQDTQDYIVYMEPHVKPVEGWEDRLRERVNGDQVVAGLVYWKPLESGEVAHVRRAAWFKGKELEAHPLDPKRKRTYYSKGVLAGKPEVFKQLPKTELERAVFLGEALRQQGLKWVDIGDLVECE